MDHTASTANDSGCRLRPPLFTFILETRSNATARICPVTYCDAIGNENITVLTLLQPFCPKLRLDVFFISRVPKKSLYKLT